MKYVYIMTVNNYNFRNEKFKEILHYSGTSRRGLWCINEPDQQAVMSTEAGSEFSMWDGSITGKNLEFIADKKIVQEWYFGDKPESSIVTIILHPDKQGTSAELRHTNIPDEDFEDISQGWDNSYFGSVIDFFGAF
jgi:activator of HSP90 ATPase